METKLSILQGHINAERWPEAFKLAKGFFTGFTKAEKETITIAGESYTVGAKFYQDLGIDLDAKRQQAKEILKTKYIKQ